MSCIHFIGGEKGGVGKSVLSRLLAQYFIDREIPFMAYDSDRSHGAMLRFYADYTTAIELDDFENIDQLVEAAMEEDRQILVDLAAQSATSLYRWIDAGDVLGVADEIGLGFRFWYVLDDGYDSMDLLTGVLDRFRGKQMNCVVVKNYGRAESFAALHWSGLAASLYVLNIPVIDLPGLHAGTMRKVDHMGCSFWAAQHNNDKELGPCLNIMERQRVKQWMQVFYTRLDELFSRSDSSCEIGG